MGLRILSEENGANVLAGSNIATSTGAAEVARSEQQLAQSLGAGQVVAVEATNVSSLVYGRSARTVLVNRAEALLVKAYRQTLTTAVEVGRVRTPFGICDLYVRDGTEVEIIEAKSGSAHAYVRDALGQLLDYVVHSPSPVDRLAGLFPARPGDGDIALLHRYGIDCLYRTADGGFTRHSAPGQRRYAMAVFWAG